jgi:hypothetical protein
MAAREGRDGPVVRERRKQAGAFLSRRSAAERGGANERGALLKHDL